MELPGVPASLLRAFSKAAEGHPLALVGGAVRDFLLHKLHCDPWRGLPDLDLVVEGSAVDLIARLSHYLPRGSACDWSEHKRFGTVSATVCLPDGQVWLIDLASARQEHYCAPAENPVVTPGRLEDELARRDFSVNAMAIVLDAEGKGVRLIDPFEAQHDLSCRRLCFLHEASVADDPTRVVRAARYVARLGFALSERSAQQVRQTINTWPWSWTLGAPPQEAPPALGPRLRMELELLLDREPFELALHALQAWGGLALLDEGLQQSRNWSLALRHADRFGCDRFTVLLACGSQSSAAAARLQLPHRHQRILREFETLRSQLIAADPTALKNWRAVEWTEWLESKPDIEQVVPLLFLCLNSYRRPLLYWWHKWRHVGPGMTANQLLLAGVPQGPAIGRKLRELRAERLRKLFNG